jgi:hypothetical protein
MYELCEVLVHVISFLRDVNNCRNDFSCPVDHTLVEEAAVSKQQLNLNRGVLDAGER